MFEQKYTQQLKELDDQVNEICQEVLDPISRLRETLCSIQTLTSDLEKYVAENPFQNQQEEVYFFKKVKPEFIARSVFESERYNIEVCKPKATEQILISYFEEELKFIDRFFKVHAFQYQYFKNGVAALDHLYFSAQSAGLVQEHELNFHGNMVHLFGKFIAFERMQDCLLLRINAIKNPQLSVSETILTKPTLKWTGDSINLVEVAYGIWLTGQINNGNASITEIVKWLEDAFQIHIGKAHRRWTEISQRKRDSYTKFIDKMKDGVFQRVDQELEVRTTGRF